MAGVNSENSSIPKTSVYSPFNVSKQLGQLNKKGIPFLRCCLSSLRLMVRVYYRQLKDGFEKRIFLATRPPPIKDPVARIMLSASITRVVFEESCTSTEVILSFLVVRSVMIRTSS